ncbi:MAG: FHA domain-containing protein [Sandaracinaceae bacterium]|nr:FHA domain-containing protein [Sandaracinaceae bacterium]
MGAPPGPPLGGPPGAAPGGGKVICPKCNAPNNPGFKFCGTCGHPLGDVAAGPPPALSPPVAAPVGAGSGTLVLIRPDGTEGDSIPFSHGTVVGRQATPQFANDSYLSPRHATFTFEGEQLRITDEGSLNGIYRRIDREDPVELADNQVFRVGQELIRFERLAPPSAGADGVQPMGSPADGLVGRICLVTGRQTTGNCYAIPAEGLHLGRERGDILFPDDGYVSGLHARIHAEGDKVFLTDVGSSNGTFLRMSGSGLVASGRMILLGQQLFRVEY